MTVDMWMDQDIEENEMWMDQDIEENEREVIMRLCSY